MDKISISRQDKSGSETHVADDAGGVPETHWYVAVVANNSEKRVAERLMDAGYRSYVASQPDVRIMRNGRRTVVDRIVIPGVVFVCCTEQERISTLKEGFAGRYLTDLASESTGSRRVARIPEGEMRNLQFMLGSSDSRVDFVGRDYVKGDSVRVVRGSLKGLCGIVDRGNGGKARLIVLLDFLGGASVEVDPVDLELIK